MAGMIPGPSREISSLSEDTGDEDDRSFVFKMGDTGICFYANRTDC